MSGSHRIRAWKVAAVIAFAGGVGAGTSAFAAEADASLGGGAQARWVSTWTSAPIRPGITTVDALFGNDSSRTFDNQTVRNVAHVSVGGRKVRVRVSNEFGTKALRVGAAYVALRRQGSAIYPATSRKLTFGGQA